MLQDFFRKLSPAGLAELLPDLSLGQAGRETHEAPPAWTELRGADRLGGLLGPAEVSRLGEGIARLARAALPPVLLYAFDDPWRGGERLRGAVSERFGAPYEILDDVWAFRVAAGATGWAPHRGTSLRLDRQAPEILNAWIAVSDAPVERACMWLVPLDDDPHAGDLEQISVEPALFRPCPLPAGDALVWNANTLHAGGTCAAGAAPRLSLTFTLLRSDHAREGDPLLGDGRVVAPEDDAWRRLELVARQLLVYGSRDGGQPDVSAELLMWARATISLGNQVRGPRP